MKLKNQRSILWKVEIELNQTIKTEPMQAERHRNVNNHLPQQSQRRGVKVAQLRHLFFHFGTLCKNLTNFCFDSMYLDYYIARCTHVFLLNGYFLPSETIHLIEKIFLHQALKTKRKDIFIYFRNTRLCLLFETNEKMYRNKMELSDFKCNMI